MHSVETAALSHAFSTGQPVLRDLALAVPRGSIYGFLGRNGAGKTTTLRLLLGLLRRQRGTIRLFGQTLDEHRTDLLRYIGSAIETPSLYAHLTAAENLAVWCAVYDCPKARIDEVLRLVGLSDARNQRAGALSLGMKQRLGLAIALLHEPPLLILDEPTNGLDPQGISEMRAFIGTLNREHGTTIIVSSHLLSEVERLVTNVGIISHGTLVFQGTLDALHSLQQGAAHTTLATSDDARAVALLTTGGWRAELVRGRVVMPAYSAAETARLNAHLVASGIGVHAIGSRRRDLEEIFLELVDAQGRA